MLACKDDDDSDVDGDDVGEDGDDDGDDDDEGVDVLACAPSSTVQSTAHECRGFQSPSSPENKFIFS